MRAGSEEKVIRTLMRGDGVLGVLVRMRRGLRWICTGRWSDGPVSGDVREECMKGFKLDEA